MTTIEQQIKDVLAVVADGSGQAVMIAEQLPHLTVHQITRRLIALEKAGKLVRKHRGIYILAPGVVVTKPVDPPKTWNQKINSFFAFRIA